MMSDICVQFVETEKTKSFKKWLGCGDQHLKWKSEMQCNVNDILFLSSAIGRTLIPRYFSTVFEGGVSDLYYILKHSKESFHNSCITVDCDQCTMVTQHGKPMFTKVKRERECVWKEKWQLSVSFSSYIPCDKPCKLLIEQTNMAGLIIYYVIHSHYSVCLLLDVVWHPHKIFQAALDSAEKALYKSITQYSLCVLSYTSDFN